MSFLLERKVQNGDNCDFYHPPLCRDWKNGRACAAGEKQCVYRHYYFGHEKKAMAASPSRTPSKTGQDRVRGATPVPNKDGAVAVDNTAEPAAYAAIAPGALMVTLAVE